MAAKLSVDRQGASDQLTCSEKHHAFESGCEKTRRSTRILFPIMGGVCSLDKYEKEISASPETVISEVLSVVTIRRPYISKLHHGKGLRLLRRTAIWDFPIVGDGSKINRKLK